MSDSAFALEARGLRKSFGGFEAVKGIDLAVAPGEIFSLLGPNGAGKSTTISMLSGLIRPTAGDAFVMGHSVSREPAAAKAALGVVPQDIALYPDLSAAENLTFWGRMYELGGSELKQRVAEVLDVIGLADRQRDAVGTFSGGMKRRVNIGVALLHRPQVVIMDEPTVGIDPQSRRHILDSVKALNAAGMAVLYTTHYMEEAEELSHRVAIVDAGRIVAEGTRAELVRRIGERDRVEVAVTGADGSVERTVEAWTNLAGVEGVTRTDGHVSLLATNGNRVVPRLFETAGAVGARISAVEVREPNLEAVFLALTGRALRD